MGRASNIYLVTHAGHPEIAFTYKSDLLVWLKGCDENTRNYYLVWIMRDAEPVHKLLGNGGWALDNKDSRWTIPRRTP